MYFADSKPANVPEVFWVRVRTQYLAPRTGIIHLGLCVIGIGRLYVDGKEFIDLWTSQPKKTLDTPMFNQASMEKTTDLKVEKGKTYQITALVRNHGTVAGVGALSVGGLRIGCCDKIDAAKALQDAVQMAKEVDVPIVIAGLNADNETEASDRKDLELPPGLNELIEKVVEANPRAVSTIWILELQLANHFTPFRLS